ncbi:hypothetical protein ACFL18_00425 [Patescibacteria group bacterium]
MTTSQSPNLTRYHFLGFALTLLATTSLLFYQLFVNFQHQRIPLTQFLSVTNLKQAFQAVKYQSPFLGEPQNLPDANLIQVRCQEFCQFYLTNLLDKSIPALVDNNSHGRLQDLTLHFYDFYNPQTGLIGYENNKTEDPIFYVIDLKPQLLQTIKLNLNQQRMLSFVSYYPKTKQILFKSTHLKNGSEEFMLYSATSPSLTLLGEHQP